jgi:hypothetical protein
LTEIYLRFEMPERMLRTLRSRFEGWQERVDVARRRRQLQRTAVQALRRADAGRLEHGFGCWLALLATARRARELEQTGECRAVAGAGRDRVGAVAPTVKKGVGGALQPLTRGAGCLWSWGGCVVLI